MSTQLTLDALEQAVWTRERDGHDLGSVVILTDRKSAQYAAIRFTGRLVETGTAASAGSVGPSYDWRSLLLPTR